MKDNPIVEKRAIDRLREYVATTKLTDMAFEKKASLSNGYLNKSSLGSGSIGSEILNKIHLAFPDLSLTWIITGEKNKKSKEYKTDQFTSVVNEPEIEYGGARIPVLELSLAAGISSVNEGMETIGNIIMPPGMVKKGRIYRCGRVTGKSMEPTILDNSWAIVMQLERAEWREMREKKIYAVVQKGDITNTQLKRLAHKWHEGEMGLSSDNGEYGNKQVQEKNVLEVWELCWNFNNEFPYNMQSDIAKLWQEIKEIKKKL